MDNTSLRQRIEAYCLANRIAIPVGFNRHPPSRYVAVIEDPDSHQWKLVARSWFTVADLLYYVAHNLEGRQYRLFDFEAMAEIEPDTVRSVMRISSISVGE